MLLTDFQNLERSTCPKPSWAAEQVHPYSCGGAVVESELNRRQVATRFANSYCFQAQVFSGNAQVRWSACPEDIAAAFARYGLVATVEIWENNNTSAGYLAAVLASGGSVVVMLSIDSNICTVDGHFVLVVPVQDPGGVGIWDPSYDRPCFSRIPILTAASVVRGVSIVVVDNRQS
jgi:hypothetical protein